MIVAHTEAGRQAGSVEAGHGGRQAGRQGDSSDVIDLSRDSDSGRARRCLPEVAVAKA